jgi:hypothetical protein
MRFERLGSLVPIGNSKERGPKPYATIRIREGPGTPYSTFRRIPFSLSRYHNIETG